MRQLQIRRALLMCALSLCLFYTTSAQTPSVKPAPTSTEVATKKPDADLDEIKQLLREQARELKNMRSLITEQSRTIDELRQRVERAENKSASPNTTLAASASDATNNTSQQQQSPRQQSQQDVPQNALPNKQSEASTGANDKTQAKKSTETIARQIGNINFSGELRLQYDSLYNQVSATPNEDNPLILGNNLSPRYRLRLRARLAMRGDIGKEFDWGLRLSTGSLSDIINSNQVLTDFYTRKQFSLDQAYLTWRPQRVPGLRLQGGKFDTPWTHTELTFDNDIQPEGVNETYAHEFKNSRVKNLTFVAWQLPFLERNSAFVRNPDNRISLDQSHRAGRDLALYGAQLRTRFDPTPKLSLTLSAADLYFSGTQFITPIQFFGNQLQLPVTVTLPANATTPAQTVTGLATIPRDLLVAGNGNLGLSTASNNATNRDGHLASGYNLVDLIGRVDYTRNHRLPLALIFNFVTNTQVRDVIAASPTAANIIQRNRENKGYWAELQAGQTKARGDYFFGYTFMRIEKDAVLTPFNYSEIAQQSDVRAQRLSFAYTVDPRVVFSVTGLFTQRANGLLGGFGATPVGSLNPATRRLQFDTTFRF